MAYVNVPKDLTNIKTKFIGNFTKRQCVCFGLGVAVGFPAYFAVRSVGGTTAAFYVLLAVLAPFFLFGIMEKDGLPLEVYLVNDIRHRFVYPPIRAGGYENIYDYYEECRRAEINGAKGEKRKNGTAKNGEQISRQSLSKRQDR